MKRFGKAAAALSCLLLAGCQGATLKDMVSGLVARDQLGPIDEIVIEAAGDYLMMGDPDVWTPEVRQSITYNYSLSRYEITNAQFKQFMDDAGYATQSYWTTNGWAAKVSGSWDQPGHWSDPLFNALDQPVIGISWYEAVAYCNWRSAKESLTPAYDLNGRIVSSAHGYRLPTEVEWEYAAAKGASGEPERLWAYGSTYVIANQVGLDYGLAYPARVGSRSPQGDTPQGLSDMSGNVDEWCSDNYESAVPAAASDRYYFNNDSSLTSFVVRGGTYQDSASYVRSAAVWYYAASDYSSPVGFRVARRLQ